MALIAPETEPQSLLNKLTISSEHGSPVASPVKIRTSEDVTRYLEICSTRTPIMEGHVCKDIHKPTVFDKFRRRYFILYRGVLLYYSSKFQYETDKRKGLKHSKVIILEDVFLTKPATSQNARLSFCLHTPHMLNKREETLVVAESRHARHLWIAGLQDQNPQLLSPVHHHHLSRRKTEPSRPVSMPVLHLTRRRANSHSKQALDSKLDSH